MKLWIFKNAWHCPNILYTLLRNVRRQKKFIKKYLGDELTLASRSSDESLGSDDFKKITSYYGLAVPAILGEALCVLRGKKMTLQERLACTYQGAFTGLFDDFFDKHQMTDELLQTFIEHPERIVARNASERLFLIFFEKALKNCWNKDLTISYLKKVYQAQIESRKQAHPGLTQNEIERITVDKGGVSVLFYRTVFLHPLSPIEEDALYHMGGLMQLGNDIFDVYKDSIAGIVTLVTTTQRVAHLRNLFKDMARSSFNAFYQTSYKRRHIKKFLRLISMSLCSRCYVCLDQLEKKEKDSNNVFSPTQYGRDDLICDMEKPGNKWRSIIYFLQNQT